MLVDVEAVEIAAKAGHLSGVVTVDVGDEKRYEACYGHAHRGLAVPVTRATRFALASGSKIMTALGVLRLVEEGAVGLDDPVRPILGNDLPLIHDAVTVEHLLDHTSGIGDYLDEEAAWKPSDYVLSVPVHTLADTEAFVSVVDGFPQVSRPGERFAYNNGGYIVLAIIIERLAEPGFHDWVEREVCGRAGLDRTSYLRSDDLPGDAAVGYLFDEGNQTNVLHLPVRGNGDGGIYSTVDDLHRFWCSLVTGQIVGSEVVQAMVTPRHFPHDGLRYGLGCYLHPTRPALLVEGYDAGVSMRSIHDPATQTTATVLANSSEGAWPVAGKLLEMFG